MSVAKLDAMFDYANSTLDFSHIEDIAGLIGQYIHGNEPSHHVAYRYLHAGVRGGRRHEPQLAPHPADRPCSSSQQR